MEEGGNELTSATRSGTFSLSAGNGVQQASLASSRDALAASKPTSKKRERERQCLEGHTDGDSAPAGAAMEAAHACVRARPLPLEYKPDASSDGLEINLGPRKTAAQSGRRKLGESKYSCDEISISNGVLNSSSGAESAPPIDDEDGDYESSSSCEGSILPNLGLRLIIPSADGFVTDEFEGSLKPLDENISKRQRLNYRQYLALSVTEVSGEPNKLDVLDSRVTKEAFVWRNGDYWIPRGCNV